MWDNVKTQFYALFRYQDFNIYEKWKNRKNSPPSASCQDINSLNYVDQSIKDLLDLAKSNSRAGICLGLLIPYALLWCINWILMKPFFSGSVIVLIFLSHSLWVNYIWPEISLPGSENTSSYMRTGSYIIGELNSQLQKTYPFILEVYTCVTKLRNYNNELFCVSSTVFFLTVVSIGSVLPGFYWAQILLIAVWFIRLGLQQLQSRDGWSSTDLEDLVPELTDYTLQVLEKAPASAKQNETFECGLAPVSPADHTIGLHFSQSHFESLGSDFEDDFEVISSDELSE